MPVGAPAAFVSKSPPKPPMDPSAPARLVPAARGLMLSTSALPASMLTPAAAYVRTPPGDEVSGESEEEVAAATAAARSRRTLATRIATASQSAGPSSACTRALSDAGVSPGRTGVFFWTRGAPESTLVST